METEGLSRFNDASAYQAVRDYVYSERERRGIQQRELTTKRKFELSCEAFGEFYNLVEGQLMCTIEGFGAWSELYGDVLLGAFVYVTTGRRDL